MIRHLDAGGNFDLDAILYGTQDFRWRRYGDEWRSGVLDGNLVHVRQAGCRLEYRAGSDLDALLRDYFRLDDDLYAVRAEVSSRDAYVARLAKKHPHLRVLRQPDAWECVVSYICSATNSVSRIAAIVEKIAEELGSPVELDGDVRHTLPTPDAVLEAGVERLAALKLGLRRHEKIIDAAERIRDGRLKLQHLAQADVCYAEAKRRLMGCRGIGDKVADCIALFALDKMEAFPVDTWVSRATKKYFPAGEQPHGDDLVMWAQDYFGRYAGYANQLLFHEQWESAQPEKRREIDSAGS